MRDFEAELLAEWAAEDAEEARVDEALLVEVEAVSQRSEPRVTPLKETMDKQDLPRERLIQHGANVLSNAELVAILLSTGDHEMNVLERSRSLLMEYGLVGLLRADVQELMRVLGLGPAKVTRVKAAVELVARGLADDEWPAREPYRTSEQVFNRYRSLLGDLVHEEVWVLVLDRQDCLIREERIYQGTVHGAHVRVAELLRPVIVHQGSAMIVVHNHPSGSLVPSRADKSVTVDLNQAASAMSIELHDHIIVTRSGFASMSQLGLMRGRPTEHAIRASRAAESTGEDRYRA